MMLPKYYCPTCGKFKSMIDVEKKWYTTKTCALVKTYGHVCKWCHEPVVKSRDAIEKILGLYGVYTFYSLME